MFLWDVRFVADGTRRIAFSKEPILEPIFRESSNIKKSFDSLRYTLWCLIIDAILDNSFKWIKKL